MNTLRWRALAIMLCLVSSAALGHWLQPTHHMSDMGAKVDLPTMFPKSFGGWKVRPQGRVAIVSPDVQAQLDSLYNQVLERTYVNEQGDEIMVSVAYGGDQSDATRAHRPDVCYPVQGFEILEKNRVLMPLSTGQHLPVEHMLAKRDTWIEPVTFWFAVGDHVAVSGTDQKLVQLRYGLQGIIPDGMLVRVSSRDSRVERAYALQEDFIRQMRRAFDPAWVPRVFGRAEGSS